MTQMIRVSDVIVDFIYKQDLNITNKELRDKVCHYSIVALHWNDLQLDNKEFSPVDTYSLTPVISSFIA